MAFAPPPGGKAVVGEAQVGLAVILVEQYYGFARELADRIVVMVRGEVALAGGPGELDEAAVRRLLTV